MSEWIRGGTMLRTLHPFDHSRNSSRCSPWRLHCKRIVCLIVPKTSLGGKYSKIPQKMSGEKPHMMPASGLVGNGEGDGISVDQIYTHVKCLPPLPVAQLWCEDFSARRSLVLGHHRSNVAIIFRNKRSLLLAQSLGGGKVSHHP